MKGYTVLKRIRHNGQRYEKGEFVSDEIIDEQSAKRLLLLKAVQKSFKDDEEKEVIKDHIEELDAPGGENEPIEDTLALNFNTDELKDGATDQGLTFKSNILKKDLIKLIVENNKTEYFLDQLDD